MTNLSVQTFRFAVVGLTSNALLYLCYILFTWMGLTPSTSMTVVFVIGTLQSFYFNKSWTFGKKQRGLHYLAKYAVLYIAAYMFNVAILHVMVDQLSYPHQLVQGMAIIVIGLLLFLVQRYWVFSSTAI